uniref:Uncharacterized protein n=1 Tax=Arundo donax TaxID=35708 RepID=A0A0A9H432_ARUDO
MIFFPYSVNGTCPKHDLVLTLASLPWCCPFTTTRYHSLVIVGG